VHFCDTRLLAMLFNKKTTQDLPGQLGVSTMVVYTWVSAFEAGSVRHGQGPGCGRRYRGLAAGQMRHRRTIFKIACGAMR
jgi:hypothetical protein